MEDFYNVRRLALVLAKQAEIEGMKVENSERKAQYLAPAYSDEDFQIKAAELNNLAYAHNEQL